MAERNRDPSVKVRQATLDFVRELGLEELGVRMPMTVGFRALTLAWRQLTKGTRAKLLQEAQRQDEEAREQAVA